MPIMVMNLKHEKTIKKGYTDDYYETWALLAQARDAIYQARDKELQPYKITPRNAAVLNIISMIGDKATPTEISRWLFRKQHSVTEIISRMERQGLVKKTKDLDRKNMVRVTLTEKGRKAHQLAFKEVCINKIVSFLPEENHRQLKSSLLILRDRAIKECQSNDKPPYPSSN